MIFVKSEETPFTIEAKVLVVVESVLEVMILLVATIPLTVLVAIFPAVVRVCVVKLERLVVETTPAELV